MLLVTSLLVVVVVGAFYEKWLLLHRYLEFWFDERTLVFVPVELAPHSMESMTSHSTMLYDQWMECPAMTSEA